MARSKKRITLEEVGPMVEHVVKHMATKEDIVDVKKEVATKEDIAGIVAELKDIKQRLKDLEAMVKDHGGHSKEIDHALERIAAIEKRLGIVRH